MGRARGVGTVLLVGALGAAAAPAHAAGGWRTGLFAEPPLSGFASVQQQPAADIAPDGTGVVAFWTTGGTTTRVTKALRVAVTTASGRPGPARTIVTAGPARQPTAVVGAAARSGGGALVAYVSGRHLHIALRTQTGRPFVRRTVGPDSGRPINALAVAPDRDHGWTVAERVYPADVGGLAYQVRVVRLDRTGHVLTDLNLGYGQFGLGSAGSSPLAFTGGRTWLAVGRIAGGGVPDGSPPVARSGLPGAAFGPALPLDTATLTPAVPRPTVPLDGTRAADVGVTPGAGKAALTWVALASHGDSGDYGAPRLAVGDAGGLLGASVGPRVASPRRTFSPVAAPLPENRWLLAWQEKAAPAAFSRIAPVRASVIGAYGEVSAPRTLIGANVGNLTTSPLADGRTLLAAASRDGAVLRRLGPDGRVETTLTPPFSRGTGVDSFLDPTRVRGAGRWLLAVQVDRFGVRWATRLLPPYPVPDAARRVEVPDLRGVISAALCKLTQAGLRWRFKGSARVYDRAVCDPNGDTYPDPVLISQSPEAGTRVPSGTVVVIDDACSKQAREGGPLCA